MGTLLAVLILALLILFAAQCSPDRPCNPVGPVPCQSIGGAR